MWGTGVSNPKCCTSKSVQQKLATNLINQDLMNILHTLRLHNSIKKLLHLQVLCSSQVLCFTYLPAENYTGFGTAKHTGPMMQSLAEDSRCQGLKNSRMIVVQKSKKQGICRTLLECSPVHLHKKRTWGHIPLHVGLLPLLQRIGIRFGQCQSAHSIV